MSYAAEGMGTEAWNLLWDSLETTTKQQREPVSGWILVYIRGSYLPSVVGVHTTAQHLDLLVLTLHSVPCWGIFPGLKAKERRQSQQIRHRNIPFLGVSHPLRALEGFSKKEKQHCEAVSKAHRDTTLTAAVINHTVQMCFTLVGAVQAGRLISTLLSPI